MTTEQIANQVVAQIPRLSVLGALSHVQNAWRDIRDERLWSWQQKQSEWFAPPTITAGTADVTRFSKTVTLDSIGKTALNTSQTDYLATTSPIKGRQFRVGNDGHVYTIRDYNTGTGVITLDRLYAGVTNTTSTYQVYKAYFEAPGGSNYKNIESVFDPDNSFALDLDHGVIEIDHKDPQRQNFGDSLWVVYLRQDFMNSSSSSMVPVYELWPHPSNERVYPITYIDRVDIDDGDFEFTFPSTIDSSLITARSMYYSCLWAAVNQGRYKELRGTSWRFVAGEHKSNYFEKLPKAKKADMEIAIMTWIQPKGSRFTSPVDGAFAQRHDVDWL